MARSQQNRIETVISAKDKVSGTLKKVAGSFDMLKEATKKGTAEFKATEGIIKSLIPKFGDFNKTTKSGTAQMTAFGGSMKKMIPQLTGATLGIVGVTMALRKLGQGFVSVSRAGGEFEKKLKELTTLYTGDMGTFTDDVTSKVYELGRAWSTSHETFLKLMYDVKSATLGSTVEEISTIAEHANALALVAQGDAVETLEVMAFVMKNYGIEAENAGYATMKLNHLVNHAKTTMRDAAGPIGKVLETASSLGVNLDQALAHMAGASVYGNLDDFATQYRQLLIQFQKPPELLSKALADLGINDMRRWMHENSGDFRKLVDQIKAWAEKEGYYVAEVIDEVRAMRALFKMDKDEFMESEAQYMADIGKEQQTYIEGLEKMQTSISEVWGRIVNVFNEAKTRIGNYLLPYLHFAGQFILKVVENIDNVFAKASGGARNSATDFNGFLGTLKTVAKGIVTVITTIRQGFGFVKIVINEITWAVYGLGVAILELGNNFEKLGEGITGIKTSEDTSKYGAEGGMFKGMAGAMKKPSMTYSEYLEYMNSGWSPTGKSPQQLKKDREAKELEEAKRKKDPYGILYKWPEGTKHKEPPKQKSLLQQWIENRDRAYKNIQSGADIYLDAMKDDRRMKKAIDQIQLGDFGGWTNPFSSSEFGQPTGQGTTNLIDEELRDEAMSDDKKKGSGSGSRAAEPNLMLNLMLNSIKLDEARNSMLNKILMKLGDKTIGQTNFNLVEGVPNP